MQAHPGGPTQQAVPSSKSEYVCYNSTAFHLGLCILPIQRTHHLQQKGAPMWFCSTLYACIITKSEHASSYH